MANFRGNIYVSQPAKNTTGSSSASADAETAYIFSDPQGLRSGNTVSVSDVLVFNGVNETFVQFTVDINASNLTQKNWRTNSDGGTVGVAGGCFELQIVGAGKTYLCFPRRVAGYYTGSASTDIVIFATCAYARTAT